MQKDTIELVIGPHDAALYTRLAQQAGLPVGAVLGILVATGYDMYRDNLDVLRAMARQAAANGAVFVSSDDVKEGRYDS